MAPEFAGLNARVKLALDEGGVAREVLPFGEEDERATGAIRAALERAGTPIGAHDTLIAGQTRPPRAHPGDRQRRGIRADCRPAAAGLDEGPGVDQGPCCRGGLAPGCGLPVGRRRANAHLTQMRAAYQTIDPSSGYSAARRASTSNCRAARRAYRPSCSISC